VCPEKFEVGKLFDHEIDVLTGIASGYSQEHDESLTDLGGYVTPHRD
jgi:hypothetical protein